MPLKNKKFDGRGGLWLSAKGHPSIAAQGSIQIGGRVIALTIWHNNMPPPAPNYNITLNEQKTNHDDIVWFKALSDPPLIDADMMMHKADNELIDAARGREPQLVGTSPTIAQCAASPIMGRKADIVIVDDLLTPNPDDDIPF